MHELNDPSRRIGLLGMRGALSSVFVVVAAVAACLGVQPAQAREAPVRIVVPVTPGGPLDVMARLLALKLAKNLQQPVVVENRVGASSIIGTEYVIKAAPDGRTLLLTATSLATNVVLFRLNFDPVADLQPVIQLNQTDTYLVTHAGLGAQNLPDLKRLAQSRPGGLNCGAPPGGMAIACERLRMALDGLVVSVPYPGVPPALNAVMAGHVDLAFIPAAAVGPAVGNPKVRVLASGGAQASRAPFANLPLLKDTWPGWVEGGFMGIFVPAGTPPAIVERLNRELNQVLADGEVRDHALRSGDALVGGAPEVLAKTLARAIESYRRTTAVMGLSPEVFR